jgi:hypothetical protein
MTYISITQYSVSHNSIFYYWRLLERRHVSTFSNRHLQAYYWTNIVASLIDVNNKKKWVVLNWMSCNTYVCHIHNTSGWIHQNEIKLYAGNISFSIIIHGACVVADYNRPISVTMQKQTQVHMNFFLHKMTDTVTSENIGLISLSPCICFEYELYKYYCLRPCCKTVPTCA